MNLKAEIEDLTREKCLMLNEAGREANHPSSTNIIVEEIGGRGDESSTKRKNRLDEEDNKVSQVLADVLFNFVMKSELVNNKRKFKLPRLSRIVVDSAALVLERMHSELVDNLATEERYIRGAKFNQSKKMLLTIMTMNDDTTTEQQVSALDASLLTRLNTRFSRFTDKSKASKIVNCLWNEAFLEGEARAAMIERVRKHVRCNVFTPSKVLEVMDLAGFNLSLAGIEVLRSVENEAMKYSRGFLPSAASILRAARIVESNADDLCPFKMIGRTFEDDGDNDFGEGFEFDVIKTTRTLLEAFGLMSDAKERSLELSITSDGAQLTHTISHVMAGIKLNDVGMRDPVTKRPLVLHGPNSLVQSRN